MSVFLPIEPGLKVMCDDHLYEVERIVDRDWVAVRDLETGQGLRLPVSELEPAPKPEPEPHGIELHEIPPEDWQVAEARLAAIKPLLRMERRTRDDVCRAAEAAGVHFTTLYSWLRSYQDSGHLSALIPLRRGPKKGLVGLPEVTNDIITLVIEEFYLSPRKPTPAMVIEEVMERCHAAGVERPHPNTVRNRIRRLPAAVSMRRRHGRAAARDRFEPIRGAFPDAEFPLSAVQIDHTEADVVLVEEGTRLPMGRPWVTLAIDVHTRMILGCYVSMDPPSAIAVGLCLSRAMLGKSGYLEALGVKGEWPASGRIRAVHADNAKEFRGRALERACAEHGIDTVFRPVKVPHYGGHIERMMGVLAGEMRRLDGATFSSPAKRGTYDASRHASMTLPEFEAYLVDFIVNRYHNERHGSLGVTPLMKWRRTAVAREDGRLVAPVQMVTDPERLVRDFMPFESRTIQRYGVSLHGVFYFDEVLTPWIDARDPKNPKKKRKFTFRYDPRNLACVWFFDPEARRYHEIPYRDLRHPPASLWELRHARRMLREQGRAEIDEDALFETIRRLRTRSEEAREKTKAARRSAHRARAAKSIQANGPAAPVASPPPPTVMPAGDPPSTVAPELLELDELTPFECDP